MSNTDENRQKVLEFLNSQHIMVLSTAFPEGQPHGAVVYYVMDDGFDLLFMTKDGTRKNSQLAANNKVAMSIGQMPPYSVQMEGAVTEIDDATEKKALIARIAEIGARHPDYWPPIIQIEAGEYTAYRIKANWVRVLDLTRKEVGPADPVLMEIDL